MYTFRICPASAILSVPKKPWTAYQYANLLHAFIEDVIGHPVCFCGANGGADFGLLLSLLYPKDIRRMVLISPEGIGTALRPTRTRNSFRSCSPPLQARSIFSSAQANGKSEPHWSRRFSQRKPFRGAGAAICTGSTLRHACTGNLCLPENTLLGGRYQACL